MASASMKGGGWRSAAYLQPTAEQPSHREALNFALVIDQRPTEINHAFGGVILRHCPMIEISIIQQFLEQSIGTLPAEDVPDGLPGLPPRSHNEDNATSRISGKSKIKPAARSACGDSRRYANSGRSRDAAVSARASRRSAVSILPERRSANLWKISCNLVGYDMTPLDELVRNAVIVPEACSESFQRRGSCGRRAVFCLLGDQLAP